MKVALISPVFPYPTKGIYVGIEKHVYEYSQALLKKGAEVHVITTFWNGGKEKEEHEGVYIHRAPDLSLRLGKLGRLFDLHYITFGKNILRFKDLLKSSDIVHTHMYLSSMNFFQDNGIPVVSHFHHRDEPAKLTDYLYIPIHYRLQKLSYSKSDAVIAVSKASKEVLIDKYGIREELIMVVPNGVNTKVFNTQNISPRIKDEFHGSFVLLFVGPLIPRKGVKYLLRGLPRVLAEKKDVLLVIIGKGPEKGRLVKLSKRLGIEGHVKFEGFVPDDEMPHYYNASDVLILPSLNEGFGMVLIEAMVCSLPVISTNTTAIPEVVGDAGILVEPRNPDALVEAIIRLIEDEGLRRELGMRGRKRVEENFTWDKVAEKMLKIYKEVAK